MIRLSHESPVSREDHSDGFVSSLSTLVGTWGNRQGKLKPCASATSGCLMTLVVPSTILPFRHEPRINNEDGAVFVDVVEFTQYRERIALWRRGISLVWLRARYRRQFGQEREVFAVLRRPATRQGAPLMKMGKSTLRRTFGSVVSGFTISCVM